MKNYENSPLSITLEGGLLRIEIGQAALRIALDHGLETHGYVVSDIKRAAEAVVGALSREEEDGSTLVHRMFDKAALYALEQGEPGFTEEAGEI